MKVVIWESRNVPDVPCAKPMMGYAELLLLHVRPGNVRGVYGHSTYAEAGTEVPFRVSEIYRIRDMERLGGIVYREVFVCCSTLSMVPGSGGLRGSKVSGTA